MTQKKSTAQRLGRVLETVTSQSSRLPDDARVRFLDSRPRVGEPGSAPHPHPDHPDAVRGGREPDRHHRRPPGDHGRVPDPERVRVRRPVDHLRGGARLHRCRSGARRVLGDPTGDEQRAMGDRGAHADEGRLAQHVLRAVAPDPRAADPVGCRYRIAHHAVRAGGHRLHPEGPSGRELQRHRRLGELLPVHRVRPETGGGTGPRSGPSAAAVRARDHGPHHAGLGARLGRSRARHPAGRHPHPVAAERDPHPNSPSPS